MSATEDFIEEFGLFSQENGGSRISGRIFGLLLVEGRELSLGQISELLKVSRASVSTNARDLARRGAIVLTSHAGDRQDYYKVADFQNFDLMGEHAERMRRHARIISSFLAPMRDENPGAASRAADLQSIFEKLAQVFTDLANSLRDADRTGKVSK